MNDELKQRAMTYIQEFGQANLTDKQLESAIREWMVSLDYSVLTRVEFANDEGGTLYDVVGLTAREVQAAKGFNMSAQEYAKYKNL